MTATGTLQRVVRRAAFGDPDLHYLPATEVLGLFRSRKLSPVEYLRALIARAEAVEPAVNAFTYSFFDQALDAAVEAEARYAGRGRRPRRLEGLPVAVKDLTAVRGQPHTLASLVFKDNIASVSAPVVERILEAGGIIHARTATPEFGCASFTHSRLWGVTRNPWNLEYSPAGSSGGAAAALAMGTTALAQGTDSAGSLRLPASACGVVGYKPPRGRVSVFPGDRFDTVYHEGPMARTVSDCALLYRAITRPEPGDMVAYPNPPRVPVRPRGVAGLRIAFVPTIGGLDFDPDVGANSRAAADALRRAGAVVDELPPLWHVDEILDAARLQFSQTYGPRVARTMEGHRELLTPYAIAFAEGLEPLARDPYAGLRAQEAVARLASRLGEVLRLHHALLTPTLQMPAPIAGDDYVDKGPLINGIEQPDRWIVATTVPFNLCNSIPVLSVPSGVSRSGVPTGIQVAGRPYDDGGAFRVALALEGALGNGGLRDA